MDQITKVRKYLKREQWLALISDYQSRGMTVTAWCKQNDICEQTYYRNLKKLREEACGSFPVPAQLGKPAVFKQLQDSAVCIRRKCCRPDTSALCHFRSV